MFKMEENMNAVMFDFDGTLTYKSPNIWKAIWQNLGYDTGSGSYFSQLFIRFMTNDISHQKWCDLTCEAFRERNLKLEMLKPIISEIKLIEGAEETFKILKSSGISLHIVSGNFDMVMREVLGDKVKYFDSINGNKINFDSNGNVISIKGTNYDFEGKAMFINEYKEKTGTNATNICFVGNGDNDEWAHLSGCKTICINPENTDISDTTKWHSALQNVTNLQQVLPELLHLQKRLPETTLKK